MKTNMLKTMAAASTLALFAALLGGATMAAADDKSFSYSLSFDGVTYSYGEHRDKHGKHTWYGFTPYSDHRFHRFSDYPGYHHVHPRHRLSYRPHNRFGHRYGHRHAPGNDRYYYRDGSLEDITYYDTDEGYVHIYEYKEGDAYTRSDEVVYYYDYEEDTSGEIHYYYGDGALLDATTDVGVGLVDVTTGLAVDIIDGVGYLLFGD